MSGLPGKNDACLFPPPQPPTPSSQIPAPTSRETRRSITSTSTNTSTSKRRASTGTTRRRIGQQWSVAQWCLTEPAAFGRTRLPRQIPAPNPQLPAPTSHETRRTIAITSTSTSKRRTSTGNGKAADRITMVGCTAVSDGNGRVLENAATDRSPRAPVFNRSCTLKACHSATARCTLKRFQRLGMTVTLHLGLGSAADALEPNP